MGHVQSKNVPGFGIIRVCVRVFSGFIRGFGMPVLGKNSLHIELVPTGFAAMSSSRLFLFVHDSRTGLGVVVDRVYIGNPCNAALRSCEVSNKVILFRGLFSRRKDCFTPKCSRTSPSLTGSAVAQVYRHSVRRPGMFASTR